MDKLYKFQPLVLLSGTIFAWATVYTDFARFYKFYGTITRIQNCVIPNPVTTPCFYGAIAFLIAFVWSLFILKRTEAARFAQQLKLNILLIASTLFAWGNFAFGVYKFYAVQNGPKVSCSGVPTDNPILTPCFFGSLIFLAALAVSLTLISRRSKNTQAPIN